MSKIYGREKKPYSIWKKMESKGVTFEQLKRIVGFRILTNSGDCYHVLGPDPRKIPHHPRPF